MRTRTILLMMVAVCVGVFLALQADHFVNRKRPVADLPVPGLIPAPNPVSVVPAALDQSSLGGTLDFRAAAKKVIPSVVSVDRYEQFRSFFDQPEGPVQQTGTGSGVILSHDGLIVTNNHVVADENGSPVPEVKVRLKGRENAYRAKVLGTDPRSDIAVIQIKADDLTPIELGSSGRLEVGQWVMAVGNPLGFDDTVSVGVVSSLKRNLPVGRGIVDAIQTDAAINPGNSGGALTDQMGRLIGINSAIASSNGGSVGIGFAIPIDRVRLVANDIIKYGHARYGSLGIDYSPRLEGALSDSDNREAIGEKVGATNVPQAGVIVVSAAGPAARVGMKPWDILLSVDGIPVRTSFDLNRALISKKPGDKAVVKWWSAGQTRTATVTLQEIDGEIQ